ncbi:hypothetical protein [Salinithrix halophila]|uniref:Transposase n=1 Tax=Salinithrix halophila TaxID=1485204 RepID=A0ABV8JM47_9BACL
MALKEKIRQLENTIQEGQTQLGDLLRENRKLRQEMKFFELMLLEEYNLLVSLMNKKNPKPRLQHL